MALPNINANLGIMQHNGHPLILPRGGQLGAPGLPQIRPQTSPSALMNTSLHPSAQLPTARRPVVQESGPSSSSKNASEAKDSDKRMDSMSGKRIFGWTTIDDVSIPYLLRDEKKFVAVRMVEMKLLSKFPSTYPEELQNKPPLMSHYVTSKEAKLLNEINAEHCGMEFGRQSFNGRDLIVKLEDFIDFYNIVRKHFPDCSSKKSKPKPPKPVDGGWIQINNTVVPYVLRGSTRFVPLSVVRYAAGLLSEVPVEGHLPSPEECTYLNDHCKKAGLTFTFAKSTKLIPSEVVTSKSDVPVHIQDLPKDDPFSYAVIKVTQEEELSQNQMASTNVNQPFPMVSQGLTTTQVSSSMHSSIPRQNIPPSSSQLWMNPHLGIYPSQAANIPQQYRPPQHFMTPAMQMLNSNQAEPLRNYLTQTAGRNTSPASRPEVNNNSSKTSQAGSVYPDSRPLSAGSRSSASEFTPAVPNQRRLSGSSLSASRGSTPPLGGNRMATVGPPGWHPTMGNPEDYQRMLQMLGGQQSSGALRSASSPGIPSTQAPLAQLARMGPSLSQPSVNPAVSSVIRGPSKGSRRSPNVTPSLSRSSSMDSLSSGKSSSKPHREGKIKPVEFFGKTLSCLIKGPAKDSYALVEAVARVYFPFCTLDEFQFALETVLKLPVTLLSNDEEKAFIDFYGLPTKTLMCNKVIKLNDFEQLMPKLHEIFKDKADAYAKRVSRKREREPSKSSDKRSKDSEIKDSQSASTSGDGAKSSALTLFKEKAKNVLKELKRGNRSYAEDYSSQPPVKSRKGLEAAVLKLKQQQLSQDDNSSVDSPNSQTQDDSSSVSDSVQMTKDASEEMDFEEPQVLHIVPVEEDADSTDNVSPSQESEQESEQNQSQAAESSDVPEVLTMPSGRDETSDENTGFYNDKDSSMSPASQTEACAVNNVSETTETVNDSSDMTSASSQTAVIASEDTADQVLPVTEENLKDIAAEGFHNQPNQPSCMETENESGEDEGSSDIQTNVSGLILVSGSSVTEADNDVAVYSSNIKETSHASVSENVSDGVSESVTTGETDSTVRSDVIMGSEKDDETKPSEDSSAEGGDNVSIMDTSCALTKVDQQSNNLIGHISEETLVMENQSNTSLEQTNVSNAETMESEVATESKETYILTTTKSDTNISNDSNLPCVVNNVSDCQKEVPCPDSENIDEFVSDTVDAEMGPLFTNEQDPMGHERTMLEGAAKEMSSDEVQLLAKNQESFLPEIDSGPCENQQDKSTNDIAVDKVHASNTQPEEQVAIDKDAVKQVDAVDDYVPNNDSPFGNCSQAGGLKLNQDVTDPSNTQNTEVEETPKPSDLPDFQQTILAVDSVIVAESQASGTVELTEADICGNDNPNGSNVELEGTVEEGNPEDFDDDDQNINLVLEDDIGQNSSEGEIDLSKAIEDPVQTATEMCVDNVEMEPIEVLDDGATQMKPLDVTEKKNQEDFGDGFNKSECENIMADKNHDIAETKTSVFALSGVSEADNGKTTDDRQDVEMLDVKTLEAEEPKDNVEDANDGSAENVEFEVEKTTVDVLEESGSRKITGDVEDLSEIQASELLETGADEVMDEDDFEMECLLLDDDEEDNMEVLENESNDETRVDPREDNEQMPTEGVGIAVDNKITIEVDNANKTTADVDEDVEKSFADDTSAEPGNKAAEELKDVNEDETPSDNTSADCGNKAGEDLKDANEIKTSSDNISSDFEIITGEDLKVVSETETSVDNPSADCENKTAENLKVVSETETSVDNPSADCENKTADDLKVVSEMETSVDNPSADCENKTAENLKVVSETETSVDNPSADCENKTAEDLKGVSEMETSVDNPPADCENKRAEDLKVVSEIETLADNTQADCENKTGEDTKVVNEMETSDCATDVKIAEGPSSVNETNVADVIEGNDKCSTTEHSSAISQSSGPEDTPSADVSLNSLPSETSHVAQTKEIPYVEESSDNTDSRPNLQ